MGREIMYFYYKVVLNSSMHKNSALSKLMLEKLPSVGNQKRLGYRTNVAEVTELFLLINETIFDNQLPVPILEVAPRCRKYWGLCYGEVEKFPNTDSYCKIKLMDKWFCKQWLIATLAHEMCHQYQWDILGEAREAQGKNRLMSHGPTFFLYRKKLEEHGISLKRAHGRRLWFKHQNLFKC